MTKHMDGKWSWWFCVQPLIYLLSCICKWYDSIRLWYCHYMMKERTWVFLPALFVNLRSLFCISRSSVFRLWQKFLRWHTCSVLLELSSSRCLLCLFPRLLFFLLLLIFYEWRAAETDKTRPLSLLQTSLLKSTDTSLGYFSLLFILVSLQFSSLSWRKLQKERRHESKRLSHTKLIHEFLSLVIPHLLPSSTGFDRQNRNWIGNKLQRNYVNTGGERRGNRTQNKTKKKDRQTLTTKFVCLGNTEKIHLWWREG